MQFLADLGAEVVKVEPPGRGAWERSWSGAETYLNGESVFYLLAHRNQRSLTLDLKSAAGKEVLWRLVRVSDVLVENFRPGVLDRLGFSYEDAARRNPRLIYCACSGYGTDGPYRDHPGQDLLIQALSGLAAITGAAGDPPTPVGTAAVDQHGAALLALGVLAALYGRTHTGKGCRVDVNLLSAALDLQIEPLNYFLNGGRLQPRSEEGLSTTFHEAPYGVYRTLDGWIAVSLAPISRLARVTGSEALAAFRDDDRFARREEVSAALARVLPQRATEEWLDLFRPAGIWSAPALQYAQVVDDPQVRSNQPFLEFDHPAAGRVRVLGHPIRYDGRPLPLRRRPPLLGEHTDEILRELDYAPEEIAGMRRDGAV